MMTRPATTPTHNGSEPDESAAELASRLPAAGMFGLFLEQQGPADQFRFGRDTADTPATP